ncbi:hypothetical protein ABXS75_14450 [Roseburia hominis]
MKKTKRILALVGVFLLIGMYACTLIFALLDDSRTMWLFKASVACTILVPVLLYAYTLFYRLSRRNDSRKMDITESTPEDKLK